MWPILTTLISAPFHRSKNLRLSSNASLGNPVVSVCRGVSARRWLRFAEKFTCALSIFFLKASDRTTGSTLLASWRCCSVLRQYHLAELRCSQALNQVKCAQCRRPDPLAGTATWCRWALPCLALQGPSELIKRVAFLTGQGRTSYRARTSRRTNTLKSWRSLPPANWRNLNADHQQPLCSGLFALLLTGFPVVFILAAAGLGFGFIGIDIRNFSTHCSRHCRCASRHRNDTLLAIPFTFMGII
jgi:hypothetical protein